MPNGKRAPLSSPVRSRRAGGFLSSAFDDGGDSGGTLDRPALKKLFADVQEHKLDTIVVYKVDRLTRSLSDFAKIVEILDAHEVSFVSVSSSPTQPPWEDSLSTSCSRLVSLNVEVTGERARQADRQP
jgi:site-specific DNA recombinase